MSRFLRVLAPVLLAGSSIAAAQDESFDDKIFHRGQETKPTECKIVDITYKEILYNLPGAPRQKVGRERIQGWEFGDPPLRFKEAEDARKDQDFEKAAELYLSAYATDDPKWVKPFSLFYRAECLLALGKSGDAGTTYNKLLKEYPENAFVPNAWIGLGRCYLLQAARKPDKKDESLARAEEAFSKLANPDFGEAWAIEGQVWRGRVLEAKGDAKGARDLYKDLAAESRGKPGGLSELAQCRAALCSVEIAIKEQSESLFEDARRELLQVVEMVKRPDVLAAAWNGLARIYFHRKQAEKKEALLCALRVITMYDSELDEQPMAHWYAIKAYTELAEKESSEEEKAEAKKQIGMLKGELKRNFPDSPWAKK
ncbi:MAG: tetratricopeptide repeat protein [Planctomycetales bacterium]|nr:tetratricopeptide repeat protein [Planctomycetales bacterium]